VIERICNKCIQTSEAEVWNNNLCPRCGYDNPLNNGNVLPDVSSIEEKPSNWTYFFAFTLFSFISSILTIVAILIGTVMFSDDLIGIWIGSFVELFTLLLVSYIVYIKVFKTLNMRTVWTWIFGLGFFRVVGWSNDLAMMREMGLDTAGLFPTWVVVWFGFLYVFKYIIQNYTDRAWPVTNLTPNPVTQSETTQQKVDKWNR